MIRQTGRALLCLFLWSSLAAASTTDPVLITLETFDEAILDYLPPRAPNVEEATHRLWNTRLKETYALGRQDGAFNIADYFNLAQCFHHLDADPELVRLAFLRGAESDPEGWREYMEQIPHGFEEILPAEYAAFMAGDAGKAAPEKETPTEVDPALLKLLEEVAARDRRHREGEGGLQDPQVAAQQRSLDARNTAIVDSLFQAHGRYLGRDLVGDRHATTMWAVIQHSTIETMERYLPILHEAARDGELGVAPLKMLIDRVHHLRTGTQIFGSQGDVELADDETIAQVRQRYGL